MGMGGRGAGKLFSQFGQANIIAHRSAVNFVRRCVRSSIVNVGKKWMVGHHWTLEFCGFSCC